MRLSIGADPEIFVRKDGELVSAYGLVEGTKKDPKKVKNGAVQVDGMALEFNIDPAKTPRKFVNNIKSVMAQLKEMVPDHEFEIAPVAKFGRKLIEEQPEEAQELGCEPDYCAYSEGQNYPPNADLPFRTASGHVHIGWTDGVDPHHPEHFKACCIFARELDFYLALPSLLMEPANNRRELYGKAGCFRPKSYGMEYRTLGNFWLKNEEYMEWVFKTIHVVSKQLVKGHTLQTSGHQSEVRRIINGNDRKLAKVYIDHLNEYFLDGVTKATIRRKA